MGRLILLRHGKAVGHDTGVADQERALTPRGQQNAHAAGLALRAAGLIPETILVSPSTRTRETWDCVKDGHGGLAARPKFVERLYEATFTTLREIVLQHAEDASDILVIGHNPSLHEAAMRLAQGLPARTLPPKAEEVVGAMPTSGWIAFSTCDFDASERSVVAAWRP